MLCREVAGVELAHGGMPGHADPYLLLVRAKPGEGSVVIRWEQFDSQAELEARLAELQEGFQSGRYAVYFESPRFAHFAEILADAGDLVKVGLLHCTRDDIVTTFWCSKLWLKPWSERPQWWHELYAEGQRDLEKMIAPAFARANR